MPFSVISDFSFQSYDDAMREAGLSKEDKKQVFKYSSESDHATVLMNDLKDRVKATESKVSKHLLCAFSRKHTKRYLHMVKIMCFVMEGAGATSLSRLFQS